MNNEGKIGLYEAVCLTSILIITKIFFTSVSLITKTAGTAAWYTTLISCIVSILFFLLIYLLMKRFPGKNIIEIFEIVLGKFLGKFLSILFCIYGIYYGGSNLREFVEMIKTHNLPYTPPSVIIFVFISVVCLGVFYGLEGVARISGAFFIPVIVGLILIYILAAPNYDIDYLKPYLGYGIQNSFILGFLRSSAYEEVFILAIIINSLHGLKTFKKAGIISLLIAGITFSLSIFFYLLAFEYTEGAENLSGIFQLSRIIYFNRYFQRMESIFLLIWVIASIIASMVSFYIPISIYCKTFRIKNHKPLIFPFAFLLFLVEMLPNSLSEVLQINLLFIRQYSLFFVYFIPVLVLILSIILRKKGEKINEAKT